jgi:hypothetical protein
MQRGKGTKIKRLAVTFLTAISLGKRKITRYKYVHFVSWHCANIIVKFCAFSAIFTYFIGFDMPTSLLLMQIFSWENYNVLLLVSLYNVV